MTAHVPPPTATPVTFSIIIPAHNGADYIEGALDSVLNQTYPHFRLFVLESGSTDHTLALVHAYDDPRLTLLTTPESLDICGNWSRILDLDLDPYLTILGQDDVLYPHFLAEIVQLIAAEPDASLYTTHFDLIDAQGHIRRACYPVPRREPADEWLVSYHQFERDSFGSGYVMRAADYRRLGGFTLFPALMFADLMTTYRFSKLAYKACAPQRAFAFRVHEQSASHQVELDDVYQAAVAYLNALEQAGHFANPVYRIAAVNFVAFLYRAHYHRVLAWLIAHGDAIQWQQYQTIKQMILSDHAQNPWFEVYDTPSRIYETLAYVRPRALRRMLYQPVRLVRWYRQRTLQSRLKTIARHH